MKTLSRITSVLAIFLFLSAGAVAGSGPEIACGDTITADTTLAQDLVCPPGTAYALIIGASNLTLSEVSEAATLVQETAHEDANIIFGQVIDDLMEDSIQVTVIATAFGGMQDEQQPAQPSGVVRMRERTEPRQQQKQVDRDIPAFVRKERHELQATRVTRVAAGSDLGLDDEYDTPTFLRKQAD